MSTWEGRHAPASRRRPGLARLGIVLGVAASLVAAAPPDARADEVRALVTIALQGAIEEIRPRFAAATGHALVPTYGLSPVVRQRVETGAAADVLISGRAGIDTLLASGKVLRGSDVELVRSLVSVAVRTGEPKPDLRSPDALKAALLAARAVAYSDPAAGGSSGVHFAKVLERLGIADAMRAKTRFPPPGGFAARLLVDGRVDLAVQQTGELLSVRGVEIAGPLPDSLQNATVYAGAIPAGSQTPDAAATLLRFLRSPEAAAILRSNGLEPL